MWVLPPRRDTTAGARLAGRKEDGEELGGDCRWEGSYGPKERLKGQDDLLSAFLSLVFSHHPFLSC